METSNTVKPITSKADTTHQYVSDEPMMGLRAYNKRKNKQPAFIQKLLLFVEVHRQLKAEYSSYERGYLSFFVIIKWQILKTVFADKSAPTWNF